MSFEPWFSSYLKSRTFVLDRGLECVLVPSPGEKAFGEVSQIRIRMPEYTRNLYKVGEEITLSPSLLREIREMALIGDIIVDPKFGLYLPAHMYNKLSFPTKSTATRRKIVNDAMDVDIYRSRVRSSAGPTLPSRIDTQGTLPGLLPNIRPRRKRRIIYLNNTPPREPKPFILESEI